VIGWDIGGAHVKAALVRNGRLEAVRQWPCALWQGLHLLDPVIDDALADWMPAHRPESGSRRRSLPNTPAGSDAGAHFDRRPEHAVTMTGEMVDLFESREDGVIRLVRHLRQRLGPKLRFFCGSGEWVDSAAGAERWQDMASANWAATARLVAGRLDEASREGIARVGHPAQAVGQTAGPATAVEQHAKGRALLVDIGSTTTDFIPLADGEILASGGGDAQRLRSGELLYQGAARTPLCALTQTIEFGRQRYNVMNEWFATTADVYRLTGELDPGHDQHPAADGGAKSIEGSCRRIARMIGHDAQDASVEDWTTFAREWRRLQISLLESGMEAVERKGSPSPLATTLSGGTMTLIGAGCGSFLVRALARTTGRAYIDFDELVDAPDSLREWVNVCAPAVAVALLREQACRAVP